MRTAWIAGLAVLLASAASGEGLLVTFDPPRKIEALKASAEDGKFVAATAGRAGEKAFHDVVAIHLGKGAPRVILADQSSPFAAVTLDRPAVVRSIVFTWKDGEATAHLATADATLRVVFEREGGKGVVKVVEAKEVPARDDFLELKITGEKQTEFIEK